MSDDIRELVRTARDFYDWGWMWGTSGNLSIRCQEDPLHIYITASGKQKGSLEESDILKVGATGEVLEGKGKPSAETRVHQGLYRKVQAGAVYHVHSVASGVASQMGWTDRRLRFQGIEMLKGLNVWEADAIVDIPIVDNFPDIANLAAAVESAANPGVPCVLVRGHGMYAWGATPFEARRHVETLEYLCEYYYRTTVATR